MQVFEKVKTFRWWLFLIFAINKFTVLQVDESESCLKRGPDTGHKIVCGTEVILQKINIFHLFSTKVQFNDEFNGFFL